MRRANSERPYGIRLKLLASYLLVALFGAGFAITALVVQFQAAERLATLEAEIAASAIVDAIGHDALERLPATQEAILELNVRHGQTVFLVDSKQRVVADANESRIGTHFRDQVNSSVALTLQDGLRRTIPAANSMPPGDSVRLILPLRKHHHDASSPIVGAIIFEYRPIYDELVAHARSFANVIGTLAIAFVILSAILGLRIASAIAKPLRELERGARAIAGGQYDARVVGVKPGDEIGTLAIAFNQMAEDLSVTRARLVEHQHELEQRIAQRTFEWQQAEAAQRESAAEFRLVAEHMPASLCYVARDLTIRYHNRQFAMLLGDAGATIDGRSLSDVVGLQTFACIQHHVSRVLSGQRTAYEIPFAPPGGEPRDFLVTLIPRIGDDGLTIGFYGVTQDVSEHKRDETALRTNNKELTEINERFQQAQTQLLQVEKMASIGKLAAGVAHEINNPIGYVNSNLNTLDRYLADIFVVLDRYGEAEASISDDALRSRIHAAKQVADLDFVKDDLRTLMAESKEGIGRVTKIVQDLKNFSRSTSDEPWQWADLHQGIDSTLNMVRNEIKYKAEVSKEYGALPKVQCRPSQLNQVFMNMLVNAGQAIKQQGTIGIRTGVEDDQVWIEFSDTGEGIKPEHLNRVFDPFFTTKAIGKGTGLGLSLTYGIVKDHGGRIDVQSTPGEGTVFRIWLPIRQRAVALSPVAVAGTGTGSAAPATLLPVAA